MQHTSDIIVENKDQRSFFLDIKAELVRQGLMMGPVVLRVGRIF